MVNYNLGVKKYGPSVEYKFSRAIQSNGFIFFGQL